MDHESMRALIGAVLLWAMGIAAVLYLIRHNWEQIREICLDENGKFDPIGGLEKKFSQSSEPQEPSQELTPDERFMSLLAKQKGAQMAGFDPERDHVREHIIFRGRVQGVGFRYRARHAADLYGCTGWVRNEWDGSVSMEIQGEEEQIYRVIRSLTQGRWIRIEKMDVKNIPLVEKEHGFKAG